MLVADPKFATTVAGGVLLPVIAIVIGAAILGGVHYIRQVLSRIDRVLKEVLPNSGSSMRDSMDRVEAEQKRVAKELRKHLRAVAVQQPVFEEMLADYLRSKQAQSAA